MCIFLGFESNYVQDRSELRDPIIIEPLKNILFDTERKSDRLPLVLCRNSELISLILYFIHQKVDLHANEKGEMLNVSSKLILKTCYIYRNTIVYRRLLSLI